MSNELLYSAPLPEGNRCRKVGVNIPVKLKDPDSGPRLGPGWLDLEEIQRELVYSCELFFSGRRESALRDTGNGAPSKPERSEFHVDGFCIEIY